MFENIIIILAIIFQFIFNAAFLGFVDSAFNNPSWGRWGWAKDLSMIFLLVPLAWLEDYGGYVVADTLAITWSWAPLVSTVLLSVVFSLLGYLAWRLKQKRNLVPTVPVVNSEDLMTKDEAFQLLKEAEALSDEDLTKAYQKSWDAMTTLMFENKPWGRASQVNSVYLTEMLYRGLVTEPSL